RPRRHGAGHGRARTHERGNPCLNGRLRKGRAVPVRLAAPHRRRPAPSRRTAKLDTVPSLKPAYLIHGDDHGRIAERRAALRALAERESGAGGLQVLEGDAATPEAAAAALSAMTLTPGRRFIVVDGVERWKEKDLGPLAEALASPPPETTIAFFAREESRATAPAALAAAVTKA